MHAAAPAPPLAARARAWSATLDRIDLRHLIWIVLGWLAVLLLVAPQHEYPTTDDYLYAGSVRDMLATGRFIMPDFSQANLVGLTVWGALWAKVVRLQLHQADRQHAGLGAGRAAGLLRAGPAVGCRAGGGAARHGAAGLQPDFRPPQLQLHDRCALPGRGPAGLLLLCARLPGRAAGLGRGRGRVRRAMPT